jgi:N-acyl-D-amino-acid deacylase
VEDRASYANPHQLSRGAVHVLVNGRFAIRDGESTGGLAGVAIPRPVARR